MISHKTPGVYVRRQQIEPPRVLELESAVPAFIGYTQRAETTQGDSLINRPIRIRSVEEFEVFFGTFFPINEIDLEVDEGRNYTVTKVTVFHRFYLYDSIRLYFDNGGTDCYVVSVGLTGEVNKEEIKFNEVKYEDLKKGLDAIATLEEPTLLVIPDVVNLVSDGQPDLRLYKDALNQCAKLQDRFLIMDIPLGYEPIKGQIDPIEAFRDSIGIHNLQYGAVYYPWIYSTFDFPVDLPDLKEEEVDTEKEEESSADQEPEVEDEMGNDPDSEQPWLYSVRGMKLQKDESPGQSSIKCTLKQMVNQQWPVKKEQRLVDAYRIAQQAVTTIKHAEDQAVQGMEERSLSLISEEQTAATPEKVEAQQQLRQAKKRLFKEHPFFQQAQDAIRLEKRKVPPSGAIAGLYVRTDQERGVWKAPANQPLESVLGPVVQIDHKMQEGLNIHTTGKSINALRSFVGRGTVVWGARTLAGNNPEWRYIPVRRLFIFIEQSIKRTLEPFVFQSNNRDTWAEVRVIIENFLTSLWRRGAMTGATTEEAFTVRVGLGETMTELDILEGRMCVQIELAASRPLEFLTLTFTCHMEEVF